VADSVWSCKEEFGSACEGLPLDYELEGKEYCVLHFPRGDKDLAAFEEAIEEKLKDKKFDFRSVYFPGKQSLASFLPNASFEGTVGFSSATFEGVADFSGVTFKEKADFSEVTFKEKADFSGVTFERDRATFEREAYFFGATFEAEADFGGAHFKGNFRKAVPTTTTPPTDFSSATFKGYANFSKAGFRHKDYERFIYERSPIEPDAPDAVAFSSATFERVADFEGAIFFGGADFKGALFKEEGKFSSLITRARAFPRFPEAVIEKPERFSFHSTFLRPSSFVDVDAEKIDFSDVEWFRFPGGEKVTLKKEIETVEARLVGRRRGDLPARGQRKLQKACRQLTKNAEESHDYPTANEFHYWSMELARKEAMALARWMASNEGTALARWNALREALRRFGLIDALYWALSGYGVRPRRAFLVLVGMGTLFAILYVMVAGSIDIEHVGQAFLYSLAAMVRLTGVPAMASLTKQLQPSEPGLSGLFQLLVTAEGILGPLQIALLALAVRRRVMR
jgi:uncharacterized protein YjbI with pentapeptide repeats